MARLLVAGTGIYNTHPTNAWVKGDIFCVKPDGFQFGREEKPPKFIIVDLPGVSVEDMEQYVGGWPEVVEEGILKPYRMSKWRWDFDTEELVHKPDNKKIKKKDL